MVPEGGGEVVRERGSLISGASPMQDTIFAKTTWSQYMLNYLVLLVIADRLNLNGFHLIINPPMVFCVFALKGTQNLLS